MIEHQRAADAPGAQLQRQQLILANLPGTMIALYDRELRIVDVEGLSGATPDGHTAESVRGAPMHVFFTAAAYADIEPLMLAALDGHRASSEHTTPDGRCFAVHIAPFFDGELITGVLTVWHDVSDRVRLERQGQAADQQSRLAFDASPIGMVMVSSDRRVHRVNRAFTSITGYGTEQIQVADPMFLVHAEDRVKVAERFGSIGADRPSVQIDHRVVRADGQTVWVDARLSLVHDEDGHPQYALAQIQDISQRRAHEQAAARHTKHLTAIAHVARAVGHSDPVEARKVVCQTAVGISDGAESASIWELAKDGSLHTTATLPDILEPRRIHRADTEHGAHLVLSTGRSLFVADAATSPHCNARIIASIGAASVLFVPITHGKRTRGVLAIGWPERLSAVPDDQRLIMDVLADEAAVAMHRADLLDRLDELTRTDPLTGLANRRAWDERLGQELAAAQRHGQPLAIAMLDLDHFKHYNDQHGHLAGDRLLRDAATAWQHRLRASDVLARWGGEEFAVLLPGCSARDAAALIDRLRELLPSDVTFSAGITITDGSTSPQHLLETADQALYDAKANGRNQSVTLTSKAVHG